MQHGEHLDRRADAIDQDVVGVDDRLARAGDAAWAVDQRVVGQSLGGVLDRRGDAIGGGRIAVGDVAGEVVKVLARLGTPEERQRHRHLARSMIARVSAIT